ncbi:hypothetical protein A3C21_01320 [Candidatus Kaiserbacteria bacterium RIFCSPHIGHO2_02_FULL_59_21]|uniref:DUF2178 domain-containing protein n=1 Tax=Candidatus Kaiserbacteria bacterium RIFCSPHIGHO2_02_FULL_59_21 TaxID=1798500 RepID=A0A1F6E157_9BACT|nr:MAG: hypothetical protein A2766_02050 [Candidatus Kaiserbacteria bacterium RIFCSPHIGHO2_01_FULL_58_22]OGG67435.1 MAG: hypothetical protein A3C21_01320 [Candidatus Kaiserbacteria bacterium RIFCSPHIGHO2_02_FULL_59_21]OGG80696.1 MAG: hypothetical protein A2952_00490 [Candidatus Kaiserbacteria bacterium RIFCSPLOWO2_01_FULL_59_34]OGG85811.1 MAG: hypothetical protein A3I47_00240 [Candidatus Kaiserbacteria bacterium RIFCSPLOWO2_02_FULL_59_19]
MARGSLPEIISATAFAAVAALLLNPFGFWMPTMAHMAMLAAAVAAFGAFAVFVLRERAVDERDAAHRSAAGRTAFLAGSATLLVGIIAEGLQSAIDPWLVVALLAMIVAKVSARVYGDRYL